MIERTYTIERTFVFAFFSFEEMRVEFVFFPSVTLITFIAALLFVVENYFLNVPVVTVLRFIEETKINKRDSS